MIKKHVLLFSDCTESECFLEMGFGHEKVISSAQRRGPAPSLSVQLSPAHPVCGINTNTNASNKEGGTIRMQNKAR